MSMNVSLIRESFHALRPHVGEVFERFYSELFRKHPAVKPLFVRVDLARQQKALANSVAHVIEYLEETDHVVDYLRKMGARHVAYGTREEHFAPVVETLIETLEYYFDEHWTPELRDAWRALLGVAAEQMIAGMREASRPAESPRAAVYEAAPMPAPTSVTPAPVPLPELVKELAHDLFRQALERELEGALREFARDRAREILRQALEDEARRLFEGNADAA
jgi:hemoglobin-like flavoprotein